MSEFQLDDAKKNEFDTYYKALDVPECTECNSKANVIPCTYGRPTKELAIYAQMGNVRLMGCCIIENKVAKGYCKTCTREIYEEQ